MPFHSILFENQDYTESTNEVPSFFADLNLDQVFQSISAGLEEYNLRPFFSTPLRDVEEITYRHEVLRDLNEKTLRADIESFAEDMRTMRLHLAQAEKLRPEYQKTSWFRDAVEIYCDAVSNLTSQLSHSEIKSQGLVSLSEYLTNYVNSEVFASLVAETEKMKKYLSQISYNIHIKDNLVTLSKYEGELDYSAKVEETFQKFKQGAAKDYRVQYRESIDMDTVEERILGQLAELYPDIFLALRRYYVKHQDYLNATIRDFDREIQFYLVYLRFIENLKSSGLNFCYPQVTNLSKEVYAHETFDLALANKLVKEHSNVVCNDFYLKNPERIFVVSGPNQGGKTTFARTFGQLHYLARLGYPVPGKEAQLFLCDHLFTHFEKEEHIENLRGKLQDELVRIHGILQQATSNSILVVNESFASTALKDALFLGRKVLQEIIQRDMLCVYVTFIDELSTISEKTVSMVSTIVPENPALRTFKIVRRVADGKAYAIAIAEKYGLSYETLKRRIAQ